METPVQFDSFRVVLVDVRNPLNIGAAARAMSNFGIAHLRLVNPYEVAFRDAVSAVGAASTLANAEVFQTLAEAIADCSLVVGTTAVGHRDLQHNLIRLEAGTPIIRAHLTGARCALLFGSEKYGLSNEDMSYCQWLMHIPTRDEHRSMNLGQAVAICLYELKRDPEVIARFPEVGAASTVELERVSDALLEALRASEYPKLNTSKSFHSAVRRVIRRMKLPQGDAEFLLGMIRQMVWKMKQLSGRQP